MRPHAGRRVAACAAVVALLAVLPVFANTAVGYVPLLAVLALLALCFGYLMLLRGKLTFAEQGPDNGCVRGEVLQFALSVRNESILPAVRIECLFYVSDAFGGGRTETRLLTLPPKSERKFDFSVRFDHIGTFQVGIRQIGVFDPLGVFYSLRGNRALHQVQIEPRLADVGAVELSDRSLVESQKTIKTFINEGMDYSGVRDYRWGDPIKSIHWKLSSKATPGNYFTRLYETPTSPGVVLLMDFECPPCGAEAMMCVYDAVIESCLSVERYAASGGFDTMTCFVDERREHLRFAGPLGDRLEGLMRHMPPMAAGSGALMLDLLAREAARIDCHNNIVVCSASITPSLVDAVIAIHGPERCPYLVAVACPDASEETMRAHRELLARLDAVRIPHVLVSAADQLAGGGR